jgi:hypothetical protein
MSEGRRRQAPGDAARIGQYLGQYLSFFSERVAVEIQADE